MVSATKFRLTDKTSTEAFLTENNIEFNVSIFFELNDLRL